MEAMAEETWAVVETLADIYHVALYHWVETKLKTLLSYIGNMSLEKTGRLSARDLGEALRVNGVDLQDASHSEDVLVTLRLFANSWKHNPVRPSRQLLRHMKLDASELVFGHLGCSKVHRALAARLGVSDGADALTGVGMEYLERAYGFLASAVSMAQIRD